MDSPTRCAAFVLAAAVAAAPVGAQPTSAPPSAASSVGASDPADAAPAPVAPEVISRDARGRITIRATRIAEAPAIDGRLDDPPYSKVKPFGDFVQQEPHEGQAASVRTDVWVLFDDAAIYVSARCWQDASLRMVANELRRDGPNQFDNDNFAVILDTFRDRRNGFMFQTNPLGAVNDQLMTDEGAVSNRDWNTVWDLRTSRDRDGWSVEMAIPFASLRFPAGRAQTWGVNFRRNLQANTEYTYLAPIPASAGRRGLARLSLAATLVGLEIPARGSRFELKPYAIGTATSDREATPPVSNDLGGRVGGDLKVGLGPGLTGDVTVYTDFAQVEEDQAQVNLTRFSLFVPEKRDFFLEGLGLFAFGGVPNSRQGAGGGPPPVAPVLFFSRRIGLADEDPVQILAGGRVTGRVGAWSVGALQVRQDESTSASLPLPETDFTVLRVRRDLFRRSSVGVIYTRRSPAETSPDTNHAGGFDLLLAPTQELSLNAYVAKTAQRGAGHDDISYRGRVDYNADRHGLVLEHLVVGDDFNPEVGLMRREDFQRSFAEARVSRRPSGNQWLKRWSVTGAFDYTTDNARVLESRNQLAAVRFELVNGDEANWTVERSYEALTEPLDLTDTHIVPIGQYTFTVARAGYQLGPRRGPVTGDVGVGVGSFYGGSLVEASYTGRVDLPARLALEPNIVINWIDLPSEPGPFWLNVLGLRATLPFSPRASVSTLVQYDTGDGGLGASVRLRWEYRPGSDLFVVYADGHDTTAPGAPMVNRSVAIKMTRLLRF
jgi:hypothetical protein